MEFFRKSLLTLFAILALGYQPTQAIEMEKRGDNYCLQLPVEVKDSILKETLMLDRLQNKSFFEVCKNLSLVCQNWKQTRENAKRWVCDYFNIAEKNKDDFWRFFEGKLIYRPNLNRDEGRVHLFISALPNPLEGEFDLSSCGDTGKVLSINTGYRKGKKEENANKTEIWTAPWFLIEGELDTMATHFKPTMDSWKQEQAPVGMFWTWGGCDNLARYDYLASESTINLSKNDLYKNWCGSRVGDGTSGQRRRELSCFVWELK
jgi:hypothetical protein